MIPLRRRARRNCERTYFGSSLDVDDTLQRPFKKNHHNKFNLELLLVQVIRQIPFQKVH